MGAVACERHGTHPSVLCCDHVRLAVEGRSLPIAFGTYQADMSGDGTLLVDNLLCAACASRFNLPKSKPIAAEIWEREDKFPYTCPTCAECLSEWQHED